MGRMSIISIPPPVPGAPAYPKLLVLDDVLIGLDMSNRMPVLDILREHSSEWYEIVRMQTEASRDWFYHELYLGTAPEGFDVPVHRGHGEGWPHLLARARQHLAAHDERDAAVYARAAFESKLQRYCEDKRVPVRYHPDPRRIEAEWFWQAVKRKAQSDGRTAALQALFSRIETFRKIVLNPLSHATHTTVTRAEIQGAIDAVEALNL